MMEINPVTKKFGFKLGYYSFINGEWKYLSAYVSSVEVHMAYKANNGVWWYTSAMSKPWREMIVPGRWRPLDGEPKPLQMLRLVGAL
ncbi:hypothetical protein HWB52_gp51 [Pseudomonas phage Littlefix]|uniref:Uncharacterized protein n=1 Tax=Pseudomonas phage Littlefix TaxID=2079289 RepID=A0A2K9VHM8_9CAUD|nr:hypothetical protein HWB52_gp51 [Pseudomonas phage Littlefix]AUV61866.1 hypothetical protein PsPhLittlefix_gp51 [Pseudomonas phage Littlefix]